MSKNRFAGWSIYDILNMSIDDFMDLSTKELRQVTQRLVSAANKRLTRLNKSGHVSPALIEAMESGGKFSTAHKDELELQVEFRRVSNFLKNKTSTVKGTLQLKNEAEKTLHDVYGINISTSDFNDLVSKYKRIMDESPDFISRSLRYKILKDYNVELADNEMTTQDIGNAVVEVLNRYYQPGGSQYDGFSDYFTVQ